MEASSDLNVRAYVTSDHVGAFRDKTKSTFIYLLHWQTGATITLFKPSYCVNKVITNSSIFSQTPGIKADEVSWLDIYGSENEHEMCPF